METRLMKWGNSQGVRLPKAVLEAMRLKSGDRVTVAVKNGNIVISPARGKYSLKELLDGITARNLHGEIATGAAVGREAW
jgi:antitoxin MazE